MYVFGKGWFLGLRVVFSSFFLNQWLGQYSLHYSKKFIIQMGSQGHSFHGFGKFSRGLQSYTVWVRKINQTMRAILLPCGWRSGTRLPVCGSFKAMVRQNLSSAGASESSGSA